MVLATRGPIVMLPRNSKKQPQYTACRSVIAPDPTLVPTLLAMSLAPLAKARTNADRIPTKNVLAILLACTPKARTSPNTAQQTTQKPNMAGHVRAQGGKSFTHALALSSPSSRAKPRPKASMVCSSSMGSLSIAAAMRARAPDSSLLFTLSYFLTILRNPSRLSCVYACRASMVRAEGRALRFTAQFTMTLSPAEHDHTSASRGPLSTMKSRILKSSSSQSSRKRSGVSYSATLSLS